MWETTNTPTSAIFQAGSLLVLIAESRTRAYLASIVPVIVNTALNEHQLVLDIVAFVQKGDFPRSRLGEKQRGKILASWVSRKMQTIAQFSIRDPDAEGSVGTAVPEEGVMLGAGAAAVLRRSSQMSAGTGTRGAGGGGGGVRASPGSLSRAPTTAGSSLRHVESVSQMTVAEELAAEQQQQQQQQRTATFRARNDNGSLQLDTPLPGPPSELESMTPPYARAGDGSGGDHTPTNERGPDQGYYHHSQQQLAGQQHQPQQQQQQQQQQQHHPQQLQQQYRHQYDPTATPPRRDEYSSVASGVYDSPSGSSLEVGHGHGYDFDVESEYGRNGGGGPATYLPNRNVGSGMGAGIGTGMGRVTSESEGLGMGMGMGMGIDLDGGAAAAAAAAHGHDHGHDQNQDRDVRYGGAGQDYAGEEYGPVSPEEYDYDGPTEYNNTSHGQGAYGYLDRNGNRDGNRYAYGTGSGARAATGTGSLRGARGLYVSNGRAESDDDDQSQGRGSRESGREEDWGRAALRQMNLNAR